jgi:hypothetical protein
MFKRAFARQAHAFPWKFEAKRRARLLCFYFHGFACIGKTSRVVPAIAARTAVKVLCDVGLRGEITRCLQQAGYRNGNQRYRSPAVAQACIAAITLSSSWNSFSRSSTT